jgi:hypothetical protein
MNKAMLDAALSYAGVPEDDFSGHQRQRAADLFEDFILPSLKRLRLLQADDDYGLFFRDVKTEEKLKVLESCTWVISDGLKLLLVKRPLSYFTLNVDVYDVTMPGPGRCGAAI